MSKKLTFLCPNCGTEQCKYTECKEVVFECRVCGASLMISATPKEVVIKMRPPADCKLILK